MIIVGLTRIRNEEAIIKEALDWHKDLCNGGIFVFDDCSTDNTMDIVLNHSAVRGTIQNPTWKPNRTKEEANNRQAILEHARKFAPEADFFLYFDADERVDMESLNLLKLHSSNCSTFDAVVMRLYDFYITPEDSHLPPKKMMRREWLGPEFRQIIMLFRNTPEAVYNRDDHREPNLPPGTRYVHLGSVRHYGKAVSVEEWESTCEYYETYFPEPYKTKWRNRKGKAIKANYLSDFGAPLIKWEERIEKGVPLKH